MDEPNVSPLQEALLRADLGFYDTAIPAAMETYLDSLLGVAMQELADNCGIAIDGEKQQDAFLSAVYAAWLYRKRTTGEAMPPMLLALIRSAQHARARRRDNDV